MNPTNTNSVQQGLNEVVINKVRRMIDGKAAGVEATLNRLQAEGKISQDFIAPIGVNLKMNDHSPVITFAHPQDGQVVMNMPDGQFTMHDNAIGQIADRMGIPQRYLRTLGLSFETLTDRQRKLAKQARDNFWRLCCENDWF